MFLNTLEKEMALTLLCTGYRKQKKLACTLTYKSKSNSCKKLAKISIYENNS